MTAISPVPKGRTARRLRDAAAIFRQLGLPCLRATHVGPSTLRTGKFAAAGAEVPVFHDHLRVVELRGRNRRGHRGDQLSHPSPGCAIDPRLPAPVLPKIEVAGLHEDRRQTPSQNFGRLLVVVQKQLARRRLEVDDGVDAGTARHRVQRRSREHAGSGTYNTEAATKEPGALAHRAGTADVDAQTIPCESQRLSLAVVGFAAHHLYYVVDDQHSIVFEDQVPGALAWAIDVKSGSPDQSAVRNHGQSARARVCGVLGRFVKRLLGVIHQGVAVTPNSPASAFAQLRRDVQEALCAFGVAAPTHVFLDVPEGLKRSLVFARLELLACLIEPIYC